MRRLLLISALLAISSIPLCAQRRTYVSPHHGGQNFSFGSHGPAMRGGANFGSRFGGPSIAFGTGAWGGGHVRVFVGSPRRSYVRRSFRPYPYSPYSYGYSYPIVVNPYYGAPYYSAFDDYAPPATVVVQPSTAPIYADNAEAGLVEEMRREHLGIYRNAEPVTPVEPRPAAKPGKEILEPAAVLIYRDGRRQEVRNYAIVGQTLWIFSEQLAHKVPLSDLNLDATRQENDERGVQFLAPVKP